MDILYLAFGATTIFSIFQVFLPYKTPQDLDLSKVQLDSKRYNKLEMYSIFWIFLSIGVICLSTASLGIVISKYLYSSIQYDYIIKTPNYYWFLPGTILGFGLIKVPMEFIYKLMLKDEYHLYTHYTNLKHGFDGYKIWRPIEIVLTTVGIAAFILGLNWYVRLEKKDNNYSIEINKLLSIQSHTYPISDISEIIYHEKYHTRKNTEINISYYIIKLKDGYIWNSNTYRFFSSTEEKINLEEQIQNLNELTQIEVTVNNK